MKRVLVGVGAACLPFLLLAVLELVLRGVDYGGDMRAVAQVERNGQAFYTMNQRVGKRFFGVDQFYYQKGAEDYFEVEKQPNTIRVFLLGASTTAGFPYEYQATPAWLLHDRLAAAFPDKRVEVINTAITATNSYAVLELVRELVRYDPDLFIVYMGQNEYYGIYGVGSTQSAGKRREVVEAYLWLQRFKTTLLLRNLIFSVVGTPNPAGGSGDIGGPTLMEEMASKAIRYGGADYREGERAIMRCRVVARGYSKTYRPRTMDHQPPQNSDSFGGRRWFLSGRNCFSHGL
ncbi:MAG TPA: SGNH/GDSL hydrolase family protein [Rhodothermales bacterium]|nr:SGNH/GDSL hydrolase family protein [Rhodothermales bacterium]